MPKEWTHWDLAHRAQRCLPPDCALHFILARHPYLYRIGAVAPDMPFYWIGGPGARPMVQSAVHLHDAPEDSFEGLKRLLDVFGRQPLPAPAAAFTMGIISHIVVDACFHPFVYYFSGVDVGHRARCARRRHFQLETYLDLYFAAGRPPARRSRLVDNLNRMEVRRPVLVEWLGQYFGLPRKAATRTVQTVLGRHARVQQLFTLPLVKRMLNGLRRLPVLDGTTIEACCYPWPTPDPSTLFPAVYTYRHPVTGRLMHHRVSEIAAEAVAQLAERFKNLAQRLPNTPAADLLADWKGPNLHTGLVGRRKTEMTNCDSSRDMLEIVFKGCPPFAG